MTREEWLAMPREIRPLVQVAFPDLDDDEREVLIQMSMGKSEQEARKFVADWDKMFGTDADD